MKVRPGESIVFKGTIYNAGDELPADYRKEEEVKVIKQSTKVKEK